MGRVFEAVARGRDISTPPSEAMHILKEIREIEADDDWDGIAAGLIAREVIFGLSHRVVPIRISKEKVVKSTSQTLVIDKTTDGEGWTIDHHRGSVAAKHYLAYSEDGETPSCTLLYRMLPEKYRTDGVLLLAATAEIMDGLYERGEREGAVREVLDRIPTLGAQSGQPNQFLRSQLIYSIADVVALLPTIDKDASIGLGCRLLVSEIRGLTSVRQIIGMCPKSAAAVVERYLEFMSHFPSDRFRKIELEGRKVSFAGSEEFEFPMPALARMLREKPGDYVLAREDGLSIRTKEPELVDAIARKLGGIVAGYGGRAGWHGMQFKEKIEYQALLEKLSKREKVMRG
ncbi:MAG: hypothetical protein KGH54_04080 [Candidatus Micrarchaeota archaeon]|nr:hypothetical protein [Candidatus Micrarchaeota archaeon]